ncbi:6-bladed beta-propeller [Gemmatimonadota bacterium]
MRISQYFMLFFAMLTCLGCSNSGNQVAVAEGQLELVWAVQPEEAEHEPWFAGIDRAKILQDRILIPDWQRNTIIQLNRNGSFLQTIGQTGPGPGEFEGGPYTLGVSPSGRIWGRLSNPGTFNVYSHDGAFIDIVDHRQLFAGTSINPFDLIPLADNSCIYHCRIISRRPSTTDEEILQTPLLVRVQGDSWITLADRWMSNEEDAVRKRLPKDSRVSLIEAFTSGVACIGQNQSEILFLKACAPYTIHRIAENQDQSSFTYLEIVREDWTKQFEYSVGEGFEFWPAQRLASSPRGEPTPYFTWTHAIQGLARYGDSLVLHIRMIEQGESHHMLYVVDLNEQRLVMTVPFDLPADEMTILSDAFQDGTLVFTVLEPVPGVRVSRIVPTR